MIASLPLSDPMVPEHDDFRKLLTATSELHKLDFRRQVRCAVAMRCDAMRCDAMRCILCGCVVLCCVSPQQCSGTPDVPLWSGEAPYGSRAVAQLWPIVVSALWAHTRTRYL